MSDNEYQKQKSIDALKCSLAVLCFGIGLLAFLVAIDRPHWFSMRPMAGVAKAMSLAGDADAVRGKPPAALSQS